MLGCLKSVADNRSVPDCLIILALSLFLLEPASAQGQLVKKSSSGLCHPPHSSYYERTKAYEAYANLDACLASGGSLPSSLKSMEVQSAANDGDYERDEFGHGWDEDSDPDCYDTRAELLISRSKEPVTFRTSNECIVDTGRWIGFFSNQVFTSAGDMDLDHVVPLAAAWEMGADDWSDGRREQFANDPINLHFTSASLNRSKGARTPAEWMPPANQCRYNEVWLLVISKYGFEPDKSTMDALVRYSGQCSDDREASIQ
ncbi:HNH endonuclease family protein [Marinobacter salarius]|uniref:GmrSD restriction endonucleases C-terminal domain-containing protein n=1 Tax=Marinobacter salarius TaxID=1420917 RepID=A0A1W6KG88_9GAMM|nr:HNH endonuclease family protein [Marinobacter salarius]ARM86339.1 hypothetical protein MARSALSMR5_04322 [Marinobacter salarius]